MLRRIAFLRLSVSLCRRAASFRRPLPCRPAAPTWSARCSARRRHRSPATRLPLRNIDTGEIVARAVAGPAGEFSYTAVPSGTYVVEALNTSGKLIATSAPLVTLESKRITPSMIVLAIAPGSGTQSSLAMSTVAPPVIAQILYAAMLARIPVVAAALVARRPPSPFM